MGAVGLAAADVEPGDDGWLPEEAHPAAAATQMSAAAAKASRPGLETPALERPDSEKPTLESPFPEYPGRGDPAAEDPALGTPAPGNTAVPFMCAAPRAPLAKYDGNASTTQAGIVVAHGG